MHDLRRRPGEDPRVRHGDRRDESRLPRRRRRPGARAPGPRRPCDLRHGRGPRLPGCGVLRSRSSASTGRAWSTATRASAYVRPLRAGDEVLVDHDDREHQVARGQRRARPALGRRRARRRADLHGHLHPRRPAPTRRRMTGRAIADVAVGDACPRRPSPSPEPTWSAMPAPAATSTSSTGTSASPARSACPT